MAITPDESGNWLTPKNTFLVLILVYLLWTRIQPLFFPKPKPVAPPPKLEYAIYSPQTLKKFNGRDNENILLAVKGKVYDVSFGRQFYGPRGPYANFAGRDASRGLAIGSFDEDALAPLDEPIDTLDDLDDTQKGSLNEWVGHFNTKYPCVGELVNQQDLAGASAAYAKQSKKDD